MARVLNPASFVLGQNAALWINKATATEMKVMGLQGLGLGLGFTQSSTTVPSMGVRIAPKVYTGAEYDEMTVNANFIPGDPTQEFLRQAALNSTIIKNSRCYLKDNCNFSAPDQPSAGGGLTTGTSGFNVGSWTDPQIGSTSDIFTNSISIAPAGPIALFVAHSAINGGAKITASGGGAGVALVLTHDDTNWEDLGFDEGDTIIIDWGVSETAPMYGTIDTLASMVMTLVADSGDSASVTAGTFVAKAQVHGATPMSVSDLDTTC